jgi:hypothetical protein
MENNLDNLQEDEVIIEDIDVDALETLDETLEQDITEAKVDPKEIDGEDDDDKEDDGEGLDDLGDEDSDVDNDGDSDEADEYLLNRRKTIAKKIAKEETEMKKLDEKDMSPELRKLWDAYKKENDKHNDIWDKMKALRAKDGHGNTPQMTALEKASYAQEKIVDKAKDAYLKLRDMDESFKSDESSLDEANDPKLTIDADVTFEVGSKAADNFIASMKAKGVAVTLKDAGNTTQAKLSGPKSALRAWASKHYGREDAEDMEPKLFEGTDPKLTIDADVTFEVGSKAADNFIASMKAKGVAVTLKDAGNTTQAKLSGPKSALRAWASKHYGREDAEDMEPKLFEGTDQSYSSEDITRLIESEEGLTEEFKDKAAIIFEAAVSAKVNEIEATLSEQYETRLSEEVESVKSVLEEQVDSYLTYAVESWMEENKVAVESSLRTQLAENFISALKTVFVENYVDVPDSKVDLFAQLEAENGNLKEETTKLNRIAESLADRVDTLVREQIVTEASAGLADTQVDKLKKLVEDVEFVDEATYRKKVSTIKEFYFNGSRETEDTTLTEDADDSFLSSTETIVEGESMNDNLSPEMKSYLTALSRMNKAVTADLL